MPNKLPELDVLTIDGIKYEVVDSKTRSDVESLTGVVQANQEATAEAINGLREQHANQSDLEDEITARTNADTELSERVGTLEETIVNKVEKKALDDETAARVDADEELASNLSNEAEVREAADTALGARLTGAETDIDNLTENKADKTALELEVANRAAALEEINTNKADKTALLAEEGARVAAIEQLEQSKVSGAELQDEAQARATADSALGTRIDGVIEDIEALDEAKASKTEVGEAIETAKSELIGAATDSIDSNTIIGLKNAINSLSVELAGADQETINTINQIKNELLDPSDESGLTSFLDKVTNLIAGFDLDKTSENYVTVKAYIDSLVGAINDHIAEHDEMVETTFVKKAAYDTDQASVNEAIENLTANKADKTDVDTLEETINTTITNEIAAIEEEIAGLSEEYLKLTDYNTDKAELDEAVAALQTGKADKTQVDTIGTTVETLQSGMLSKVNQSDFNDLDEKVDQLAETVNGKAAQQDVEALVATIADKADKAELEALEESVNGKANQTDLVSIQSQLSGKASQTDMDAVQSEIVGKASQTDLEALQTDVAGKAEIEDLDLLTQEVATKATKEELTTLSGVVDTKATKSELDDVRGVLNGKAAQSDLEALQTAVNGKASQDDLTLLTNTVNSIVPEVETINETLETLDTTYVKVADYEADEEVIAAAINDLDSSKASNEDLAALGNVVATKASQTALNEVIDEVNVVKGTNADTSATNSLVGLRKAINELSQMFTGADASTIEVLQQIQQELANPSADGSMSSFLDKIYTVIGGFQWEDQEAADYTGTIKQYIDSKDAADKQELVARLTTDEANISNNTSLIETEISARTAAETAINSIIATKANANDFVEKTITYITNVEYENGELSLTTVTERVWVPRTQTTEPEPEPEA